MWQQLDLTPALTIHAGIPPAPCVIHIALKGADRSYLETHLPSILPYAFIPRLCIDFFCSGEGQPTGIAVRGLVDQALRGLFEKDLAEIAPALAQPGLVSLWQRRCDEVDVIAAALKGFSCDGYSDGPEDNEEKLKAELWAVVVRHARTKVRLKWAVWDGASGCQQEEEDGEESEDREEEQDEDMLLYESDNDSLLYGLDDEGSREAEEDVLRDADDAMEVRNTPTETEI